MKVILAKNAGFCEGVKRAFNMAKQVARKGKRPIFILGPLVHNEEVIRHLEKQGIKKIENFEELAQGTLIISAHGVGPNIQTRVREKEIEIRDATCPKVLKTHILADFSKKKNIPLIIIGDKKHREVQGISGWAGKKAVVISEIEEIKDIKFEKDKPVNLISQTTQDVEKVKKLIAFLKKQLTQLRVYNTICLATFKRQKEIRKLAKENDIVIVVGSKTSANTKRLVKIAQEINPKTYFISKASGLKKEWLRGIKTAAVTAGASTPDWIIKKVVDKLRVL